MGKSKIFVVEDDLMYSKLLSHKLSMDPEFEVSAFNDGESFLKKLHLKPDVVTLDHSLPDITGLELLKKIKKEHPNIQVVILSAQENVATAIELIQSGAYDYILKDSNSMDKIWHTVHQANEKRELKEEVEFLTNEISEKYNFQQYIKGSSAPMQRIFSLLEKTAKTNITVAITGQTGTGKELVAKAIHFNSERMKRPFIAINVAAIPKELIESELFGYEKGAFTGADQSRAGKFEEANKGTLFLDEIGEMDLNMQSKLLRALQEREVTRLGSNKLIPLDVRIIVATHRDLQKEVKAGNFREDLYYRLLGISVDLPPLSDRGNDIILLAITFTTDFCVENKLQKKDFTQEAIDKLLKYGYPGNVRELKAVVEIASVMSDGNLIKDTDIQFNERTDVEDLLQENLTLEEFNAKIIRWNLKKFNHNVLKVAERLDIGKSTIYRMMKEGKI